MKRTVFYTVVADAEQDRVRLPPDRNYDRTQWLNRSSHIMSHGGRIRTHQTGLHSAHINVLVFFCPNWDRKKHPKFGSGLSYIPVPQYEQQTVTE